MKKHQRALGFGILLFIGACTPVTTTTDPFGNSALIVECNWVLPVSCYNKAVKMCPNGYHLVDKHMEGGLFPVNKSITIRCK